jgi:predicted O-methyltransferase YrrM
MSKEISKREVERIYQEYNDRYGIWGWCSLNKAGIIIDYMEDVFSRVDNPVCVEIGIYGGMSALPVLLDMKRLKTGKFYAIDPWSNEEATKGYEEKHYDYWNNIDLNHVYNIFDTMLKETGTEEYVEIIKKPSDEAPKIYSIDFLYIDGQHTDQAIRDANKYASQVKQDGYCIVDDVEWGEVSQVPDAMVKMGFEALFRIDEAVIFKRKFMS